MTGDGVGQRLLPCMLPGSVATLSAANPERTCACGAVLRGQQRLYCSPRCRVAEWDRKHPRLGRPRRYGVVLALHSDGATYDPALDGARLTSLRDRIVALMRDGAWRYSWQIVAACGGTDASVTAKLRDLRKPQFARKYGVRAMESRRGRTAGAWEYRVEVAA